MRACRCRAAGRPGARGRDQVAQHACLTSAGRRSHAVSGGEGVALAKRACMAATGRGGAGAQRPAAATATPPRTSSHRSGNMTGATAAESKAELAAGEGARPFFSTMAEAQIEVEREDPASLALSRGRGRPDGAAESRVAQRPRQKGGGQRVHSAVRCARPATSVREEREERGGVCRLRQRDAGSSPRGSETPNGQVTHQRATARRRRCRQEVRGLRSGDVQAGGRQQPVTPRTRGQRPEKKTRSLTSAAATTCA